MDDNHHTKLIEMQKDLNNSAFLYDHQASEQRDKIIDYVNKNNFGWKINECLKS